MKTKNAFLACGLAALSWSAQALQIISLSPQGEVAQVRQLVAKFDESAVNFGDPKAEAPLTLSCSDAQVTKGTGRWVNDRVWAYDFDRDLPPGVRCTVQTKPGFKSPKGADITGASSYKFNSGGPFVRSIQPYQGYRIDEEQFFILQLSGPATLESVKANVWCKASDLGEKISIRLLEGKERAALLEAQGLDGYAKADPLSYVTMTCARRLSSSAKVSVVFGKGVATPANGTIPGVPNTVERQFAYQVREPFAANFSCERENAQAACLPIRPLQLSFNAPVSAKLLQAIRLSDGKNTLQARARGRQR